MITAENVYEPAREVFDEWLDANLPNVRRIYTDPERLHFWRSFGAGILLGGLHAGRNGYQELETLMLEANARMPEELPA